MPLGRLPNRVGPVPEPVLLGPVLVLYNEVPNAKPNPAKPQILNSEAHLSRLRTQAPPGVFADF